MEKSFDEMCKYAEEFVLTHSKISNVFLQREFRIGYNTSNEIMDYLKSKGIMENTDDKMTFGVAITCVGDTTCIKRRLWVFGIYVYKVPASDFTVNRAPLNQILPAGTQIKHNPHLAIIDNGVVSNWLPTNEDIFATDWEVHENG